MRVSKEGGFNCGSKIGKWLPRYCLIHNKIFKAYKDIENNELDCVLDFDFTSCSLEPDYSFNIFT